MGIPGPIACYIRCAAGLATLPRSNDGFEQFNELYNGDESVKSYLFACSLFMRTGLRVALYPCSFGVRHDGVGNECATSGREPGKIMSGQFSKSADPFAWSSCSREYITSFLE